MDVVGAGVERGRAGGGAAPAARAGGAHPGTAEGAGGAGGLIGVQRLPLSAHPYFDEVIMRGRLFGALTFVSCLAATLSHTSTAAACGGCFHGPNNSTPSVVTGHRMALAISPARTVLWDQ